MSSSSSSSASPNDAQFSALRDNGFSARTCRCSNHDTQPTTGNTWAGVADSHKVLDCVRLQLGRASTMINDALMMDPEEKLARGIAADQTPRAGDQPESPARWTSVMRSSFRSSIEWNWCRLAMQCYDKDDNPCYLLAEVVPASYMAAPGYQTDHQRSLSSKTAFW